ncbi:MAG: hypothetical protein AAFO74_08300 [Pseudomonadota bacterium]
MINWLKSLLSIQPAPQKTVELQAKLLPDTGAGMFGEAEFELYSNDGWELEAEVDFRNGDRARPLSLWLDGQEVLALRPDDHDESEGKLSSRRGDALNVLPREGMAVAVKDGAATLLTGVFELHPRYR